MTMKTFKNFKEAYACYKQGEIDGIIIRDIAACQANIINETNSSEGSASLSEEQLCDILKASDDSEENDFAWSLGGYMHICETEEDLQNIIGLDWKWEEEHGRPPNVTEVATSWDACDYVFGDPATGWGIFLLCTNNAGGHVYYVPETLWEASRFKEHFALSNPTVS